MSSDSLAITAEAIRNRIALIDPIQIDGWDSRLNGLENDIEKTFSVADIQRARNKKVLNQDTADQLTSMRSTMPLLANRQEMIDFLQSANASQRAWLNSLLPPPPGAPPAF